MNELEIVSELHIVVVGECEYVVVAVVKIASIFGGNNSDSKGNFVVQPAHDA